MTRDNIRTAYTTAYGLHPRIEVADAVLFETFGAFGRRLRRQQRPSTTVTQYNASLTPHQLRQRTDLSGVGPYALIQELAVGRLLCDCRIGPCPSP